jgi:positive regulator of sigma E activity
MNKKAMIYLGIILPLAVFAVLCLLLLTSIISVSVFAFLAFITTWLSIFANWYRINYEKNQFTPILDKVEIIIFAIFLSPFVVFLINAITRDYLSPLTGQFLLLFGIFSFSTLIAHIADRKSEWNKQQSNAIQ